MSALHLSVSHPPPLPVDQEAELSAEEIEARRIAEMGKPVLGEHGRLEVVIEESYEFKVARYCCDPDLSQYVIS